MPGIAVGAGMLGITGQTAEALVGVGPADAEVDHDEAAAGDVGSSPGCCPPVSPLSRWASLRLGALPAPGCSWRPPRRSATGAEDEAEDGEVVGVGPAEALASLPLPFPVPFNAAVRLADPRCAQDAAPPPGVSRPAHIPPAGPLHLAVACLGSGAMPRRMRLAATAARPEASAAVSC